mgnify:CR=1 FL=1
MPIKITNTGSVVYKPKYMGPKQYTDQFTGRIFNTVDSGVVAPYERTGIGTGGTEAPNPVTIATRLESSSSDGKTLPATKGSDATLKSINCLSFDGTDDRIDFSLGSFNTSAFNVKATIETASTLQSQGDLFSQAAGTGTGRGWVRINSNGSATTFLGGQGSTVLAPAGTFTTSTKYDVELIYNGSNSLQLKTTTGGTTTTHTAVTRTVEEATGAFKFFAGHTGASPLEGKGSKLIITSGSDTLLHAPLAEGSGTKAYDVSGNGNHGTIDGATWTTEDGIESWNHEYGFDINAVFNGSSDHIDLSSGFTLGTSWELETTLASSGDGTGDGRPFGMVEGGDILQFESRTGESFRWFLRDTASTATIQQDVTPTDRSDFNTYKVERDGDTITFYINGSSVATKDSTSFGNIVIANPIIGARTGNTANFDGKMKTWKLTIDGSIAVDYDFAVNPDSGDYTKERIPALNTKTKQVATFDGVADYVDTGISINATDVIECKFKYKGSTSADVVIFGNREGSNNLYFGLQGGNWRFAHSVSAGGGVTDTGTVDNSIHTIVYNGDGTFTLDNILNVDMSSESTPTITQNTYLGGRNLNNAPSKYSNVEIHSWKVTRGGSVLQEFDFQNDIGTTTVQDLTTNDNDGTVTVGSGGTESFWGTRVADNDGELVSADYATLNGTTFNNSAGFVHNNSECSISFNSRSLAASSLSDFQNNVEPGLSGVWINKTNDGFVTELVEYDNSYTRASSGATFAVNTKYFDGREI